MRLCLAVWGTLGLAAAAPAFAADVFVWPIPVSFNATGPSVPLSPSFKIVARGAAANSSLLQDAIARYQAIVVSNLATPSVADVPSIDELVVQVTGDVVDGPPKLETAYDYQLSIRTGGKAKPPIAHAEASSIFGAMYALETFAQLSVNGSLAHGDIDIRDAPEYRWRGLMLDAGRRFFPVELVQNLIDVMAANKMNVLHFHLSDYCRWAVESILYPELTAGADVTGLSPGFYTQDEIRGIVKYATARGIRVVPEFDLPGHSRALLPLRSRGIEFCTDSGAENQIYDDPDGKSFAVLKALLSEMAGLFPDKVMHIGDDETYVRGKCTGATIKSLERKILEALASNTKNPKVPMGWDPIVSVASTDTILEAWVKGAGVFASKGYRVVAADNGPFYLTHPAGWDQDRQGCAPFGCADEKGWAFSWHDISKTMPKAANASVQALLLGGEASLWTDDYVLPAECGAWPGRVPANGSALYSRSLDKAFARSAGALTWPRGYIVAGALWNFDAKIDIKAASVKSGLRRHNDAIANRGGLVCPNGCKCSYCGTVCPRPDGTFPDALEPYDPTIKSDGANCTVKKQLSLESLVI